MLGQLWSNWNQLYGFCYQKNCSWGLRWTQIDKFSRCLFGLQVIPSGGNHDHVNQPRFASLVRYWQYLAADQTHGRPAKSLHVPIKVWEIHGKIKSHDPTHHGFIMRLSTTNNIQQPPLSAYVCKRRLQSGSVPRCLATCLPRFPNMAGLLPCPNSREPGTNSDVLKGFHDKKGIKWIWGVVDQKTLWRAKIWKFPFNTPIDELSWDHFG
jgi:hypothetical protein